MKNPAMRPELSLLSRFQGGTHIRPHGLGLTLPLCVGRYRQIIWRCRLAASRFSQFAACSGAPSHRPSLGSGTTQTFKVRLQQGFAPGEMGFNDKFCAAKNPERSLSALGRSPIPGARIFGYMINGTRPLSFNVRSHCFRCSGDRPNS